MSAPISRGDFVNPSDDLPASARSVVETLLSDVQRAQTICGQEEDYDHQLSYASVETVRNDFMVKYNLSMVDIVKAHTRLTIKASLETHCLTAFPYEAALDQARVYDEKMASEGSRSVKCQFPLLGLVFSVKDCIHVRGLATTLGCSSLANNVQPMSARIVSDLERLGAIMLAKTASPQLMLSNTTESPLWGKVRSPMGEEFQVGGSSGGEAALVRYGGSKLGVGTDMGGSVRQPACLNELYGLKLQSNHIPWDSPRDYITGLPDTQVPATAPGFLCRDLHTLYTVLEALNLGSDPRIDRSSQSLPQQHIRWTSQESSSEVAALIKMVHTRLDYPSSQLGKVDSQHWANVWSEFAKSQGFGPARQMLDTDPLIRRTMFDETLLESAAGACKYDLQTVRQQFTDLVFVDGAAPGSTVFMTPTHMLGPCPHDVFCQADDTGVAEVWCQIFNLLDWPAISIPIDTPIAADTSDVSNVTSLEAKKLLESLHSQSRHCFVKDPFDVTPRKPRMSIQLATTPGNEDQLISCANRIYETWR